MRDVSFQIAKFFLSAELGAHNSIYCSQQHFLQQKALYAGAF